MAVDERRAKRRWGFRDDEPKAKKKERGKVVVPQVKQSSGSTSTDASKILERRALERIIHSLPSHLRTQWPSGNSDLTAEHNGDVRFTVTLIHKSKYQIIESIGIPREYIETANIDKINALADDLATRIVREIRTFHESESGSRRAVPPPPKYDPSDDSFFKEQIAGALSKKQTDKMKKKVVGTAGPFCIICGAEDRTKFPDWNTCPHNPEGST